MLRGVNVGGNNIIKMTEFRDLCAALNFAKPETLIQSGNIVFEARAKSSSDVATIISDAIQSKYGFRPETVVRTADEMQGVIDRNPFVDRMANLDGAKLAVTFFAARLDALPTLSAQTSEEVHSTEKEIYVYYPDGMGRSKLVLQLDRALKGNAATTRNWNTVLKLAAMADARRKG